MIFFFVKLVAHNFAYIACICATLRATSSLFFLRTLYKTFNVFWMHNNCFTREKKNNDINDCSNFKVCPNLRQKISTISLSFILVSIKRNFEEEKILTNTISFKYHKMAITIFNDSGNFLDNKSNILKSRSRLTKFW